MYFLRVESSFSAALYLSNSNEKQKSMHGHDFTVTLVLKSDTLNRSGMVWDYIDIQDKLDLITSSLDHSLLNDVQEFIDSNPTGENLAKFFYNKIMDLNQDIPLYEVSVCGARGVCAGYRHNA